MRTRMVGVPYLYRQALEAEGRHADGGGGGAPTCPYCLANGYDACVLMRRELGGLGGLREVWLLLIGRSDDRDLRTTG